MSDPWYNDATGYGTDDMCRLHGEPSSSPNYRSGGYGENYYRSSPSYDNRSYGRETDAERYEREVGYDRGYRY